MGENVVQFSTLTKARWGLDLWRNVAILRDTKMAWRKPKHDISTKLALNEYLPDDRCFWVVFDMSNGNKGSQRYMWWFDTKKDALAHIKHQKTVKYGAQLSVPHKVEMV